MTCSIGRVEAGNGFLVTCPRCPRFRTIRRTHPLAVLAAASHDQQHHTPGRQVLSR